MAVRTGIEFVSRLLRRGNSATGVQIAGRGNQQAARDFVIMNFSTNENGDVEGGAAGSRPARRLGESDADLLLELARDGSESFRMRSMEGTILKVGDMVTNSKASTPHFDRLNASVDRLEAAGLLTVSAGDMIRPTNAGRQEARVLREERIILANSHRWNGGCVAIDFDREGTIIQIGPFDREYIAEREQAFERLLACGALVDSGAGSYRISPEWSPRARELREKYLLTPA